MDIPIYKEMYFQVFILIYLILSIITSFVCYRISKRNGLSILFWAIVGWLIPVIPYLYLRFKYKN